MSLGWLKSQKKRRTTSRKNEPVAPMSAEDQQEWLKGTPYDSFVKSKDKVTKRSAAKAAS